MLDTSKPYSVYVLYSDSADRFYIGVSGDVEQRFERHNSGQSRWTARYRPWRCVFRRQLADLTEALKVEKLLKRQRRGAGFFRLTGLRAADYPARRGSQSTDLQG